MRKIHRKTRTGCTQCKRRRVKCQEQKPTCSGCIRNHLECSLEFLTPMSSTSRPNPAAVSSSEPIAPRPIPIPLSDAYTREVMYHYNACIELSLPDMRRRLVWGLDVPRMGLEHTFLLSGIKAVTALHLATLSPIRKQELQTYAVMAIGSALHSFRESMRKSIGQTVHASFVFAGSVIYYIMAFPEALDATRKVDRCRIPSKYDEHPHWFLMMRARAILFARNQHELATGPFAPLLEGDPGPTHPVLDSSEDEHLVELEETCSIHPQIPGAITLNPSIEERREAEICKIAIRALRHSSGFIHPRLSQSNARILYDKTAINIWPGIISQDFLELIYKRNSRALVILAHYCILLKKDDHVWCLKGVGSGLLENIWDAVSDEWRPWLRWPMEHPCSTCCSFTAAGTRTSYTFGCR